MGDDAISISSCRANARAGGVAHVCIRAVLMLCCVHVLLAARLFTAAVLRPASAGDSRAHNIREKPSFPAAKTKIRVAKCSRVLLVLIRAGNKVNISHHSFWCEC